MSEEINSFWASKLEQLQTAPPAAPGESSIESKEFFQRKRAELEHGRQQRGTIAEEHTPRKIHPGALIGGMAGFALGGPMGAVGGAVAGEVIQQGYDYLANTGHAPRSIESGAVDVVKEGAAALVGEGAGGALRFFKPPKFATPRVLTPEQQQRLEIRRRYQIPTSPDEITGAYSHRAMRAVSEASMFSGRSWDEFRRNESRAIRGAFEGIVDTVAERSTAQDLMQTYVDYVRDTTRSIHNDFASPLYNSIDQALQPQKITRQVSTGRQLPNPNGLLDPNGQPLTAPELIDQEERVGGLLVNNTEIRNLFAQEIQRTRDAGAAQGEMGKDLTKSPDFIWKQKIASLPENSQWVDQHETLKEIRANLRLLNTPGVDPSQLPTRRVLVQAERAIEEQLRRGLQLSGNPEHRDLLRLWDHAQAYIRDAHTRMDGPVIQRFMTQMESRGGEPALRQFVKTLSPNELEQSMAALEGNRALGLEPNIPLRDRMIRAWLAEGIEEAGGPRDLDQPFNVTKFHSWIYGKTELTGGKDRVLLDRIPQARQRIDELLEATRAQDQRQSKFGEVFVKMRQAGAIFTIPRTAIQSVMGGMLGLEAYRDVGSGNYWEAAGDAAGAITIVAGPSVLAGLMLNPRTAAYMIQGMRYSVPNATKTVGGTPAFNAAGQPMMSGGKEVPTGVAQATRVFRELVRLDQNFARLVQSQVSAQLHTPEMAAESFTDLRTRGAQLIDQMPQ